MGLLDFLSPAGETDKRAESVRSGAVAPLRTERQKCYLARDAYFACLDANGIVDALKDGGKEAARACGPEGKGFERDCASEWVTYFKKWRVQDIKKKQMLKELEAKGAMKMDVNTEFKPR